MRAVLVARRAERPASSSRRSTARNRASASENRPITSRASARSSSTCARRGPDTDAAPGASACSSRSTAVAELSVSAAARPRPGPRPRDGHRCGRGGARAALRAGRRSRAVTPRRGRARLGVRRTGACGTRPPGGGGGGTGTGRRRRTRTPARSGPAAPRPRSRYQRPRRGGRRSTRGRAPRRPPTSGEPRPGPGRTRPRSASSTVAGRSSSVDGPVAAVASTSRNSGNPPERSTIRSTWWGSSIGAIRRTTSAASRAGSGPSSMRGTLTGAPAHPRRVGAPRRRGTPRGGRGEATEQLGRERIEPLRVVHDHERPAAAGALGGAPRRSVRAGSVAGPGRCRRSGGSRSTGGPWRREQRSPRRQLGTDVGEESLDRVLVDLDAAEGAPRHVVTRPCPTAPWSANRRYRPPTTCSSAPPSRSATMARSVDLPTPAPAITSTARDEVASTVSQSPAIRSSSRSRPRTIRGPASGSRSRHRARSRDRADRAAAFPLAANGSTGSHGDRRVIRRASPPRTGAHPTPPSLRPGPPGSPHRRSPRRSGDRTSRCRRRRPAPG